MPPRVRTVGCLRLRDARRQCICRMRCLIRLFFVLSEFWLRLAAATREAALESRSCLCMHTRL